MGNRSAMQHDKQAETDREYEARARLLATLAGRASDASIAIAQWQLAKCYALLARWRRQRRSDADDRNTNKQS
jgi:hypothetical protein